MKKNIFQKIKETFKKFIDICDLEIVEKVVCFVCENDCLPLALSSEDEKVYLEMLSGENEELAKQKLVKHNIRLVVYIAKKFENSGYDVDDLISVGAIGLIKAINSFKNDKNIKLATYASRCIENEILMHLRKNNKFKMEMSLDEPLNIDYDGDELSLADVLATETDIVSTSLDVRSEKSMVQSAISKLNEREKEIMQMRFGLDGQEEKTQKEVADMLGISQSYISRLEKKIYTRLKKEVQKLG